MKKFPLIFLVILLTLTHSTYAVTPKANIATQASSNNVKPDDDLKISTRKGDIYFATKEEIDTALATFENEKSAKDKEENQKRINLYNEGLSAIEQLQNLKQKRIKLDETLGHAQSDITKFNEELILNENKTENKNSSFDSLSEKKLTDKFGALQLELSDNQSLYDSAVAAQSEIQNLPESSQTTINQNLNTIKRMLIDIERSENLESLDNKVRALIINTCNYENLLYKYKLSNLSLLQNLYNLEVKVYAEKIANIEAQQKQILEKIGQLKGSDKQFNIVLDSKIINSDFDLLTLVNDINLLQKQLEKAEKQFHVYEEDYKQVKDANAHCEQIISKMMGQLKELNKNLLLSRLLNKELAILPNFQLKYNVDERITSLNINLYDIRETTSQIDSEKNNLKKIIKNNPALEPYKEQILEMYSYRKQAYDELYQTYANSLSIAIEIKSKYNSYQNIYKKIQSEIEEQLFWIKSNQPISSEFFKQLTITISQELRGLILKLDSEEYLSTFFKNMFVIFSPLLVLYVIIIIFKNKLARYTDKIARRLDHRNDAIYLTPLSIAIHILLMVPRLIWMGFLGAILVCISLNSAENLAYVIIVMMLHVSVFVYCLEILKPNSLVQRHFGISPKQVEHYRKILNSIWYIALPLIIIANVAESDAQDIYTDISAYFIVLISSIALLIISAKLLINNIIRFRFLSITYVIICLLAVASTAITIVAVASGYLYTVVKLTNRFAFTYYILFGYFLLNNTVHRMLHTYINRIYTKVSLLHSDKNTFNATDNSKEIMFLNFIDTLNLNASKLTNKIFGYINTVLIIATLIFLYIQWNDLSSVLGYLDNIRLWDHEEIINGKKQVTDYLSIANILYGLIIILITVFLNRYIPYLLEKVILINKNTRFKSTSYSVKVLTSYIIIGLGGVLSAGVIGIKWENLQWLVAALSVGLGFGLQEIFANFVSGVILLFERQLRVGDIVTINGLSGTVVKIRIRSTTVLSFENKEVMIPNRSFITTALTNWSLSSTVTKLEYNVVIAYGADYEKAKNILFNIAKKCPYIDKSKQILVYISNLADSSVNISCEIYVNAISQRKLTLDYLSRECLRLYEKEGIEIPFNQMDVHVKTLEKEEFIEKLKNGLFVKEPAEGSEIKSK